MQVINNSKLDKENFLENIVKPYHYANQTRGEWYICNLDWAEPRYIMFSNDAQNAEPWLRNPKVTVNEVIDYFPNLKPFFHSIDGNLCQNKRVLDILELVENDIFLLTDIPIILPTTDEVIAFYTVMRKLDCETSSKIRDNHYRILNENNVAIVSSNQPSSVNLAKVEEVVLYSLLNGKTQREIGEQLNVSRGHISNLIAAMCDKFDIIGSSQKHLIEKARHYNYHLYIPRLDFGNL